MSYTAASYQCPSCSAPITFSPDKQVFACEFCLSSFTTEEMEKHHQEKMHRDIQRNKKKDAIAKERSDNLDESEETMHEYSCQSCGAHVVTTDTTTSTFCFYCHNPVVITSRLQGDFTPDQILPFKISEQQAKDGFIAWASTKKYLPDDFISASHLEKMTGMYIPYWYVDTSVQVDYSGTSSRKDTWRSGDFMYTKTSESEHVRKGEYQINDVSLQAFSKIDPNLLNGVEPYDGEDFRPFSMPLLQGYFAEQYTMSEEEARDPMNQSIGQIAEQLLQSSFPPNATVKHRHKTIQGGENDLLFSLLPVWVLTYNYYGKIYVYAMNGQDGRAFGEMPLVEERLKSDARKRGLLTGLLVGLIAMILSAVLFIFQFF